jgi:hypothetical protein
MQIGLLAGTALVLVVALGVFGFAALTTAAVRDRSGPAVLYVVAAQRELLTADQEAIAGFGNGYSPLGGANADYQNQLTQAEQHLEQAAGANAAGSDGSQQLQLASGLVVSYIGMIEQAGTDYNANITLGAAQALYASQVMRRHDDGIVNDLGTLRSVEQDRVTAGENSFWTSPWTVLLWLVPALALLVALVLAQRYLAARFRRRFNWPLVAATVLLAALAAGAVVTLVSDAQLRVAGRDIAKVVADQPPSNGTGDLGTRLAHACGTGGTCQAAISTYSDEPARTGASADQLATDIATATTDANRAATTHGVEYVIPGLGFAIAALIALGLRPRIDEYRFRP